MEELKREIEDLKGIIASYETLHELSQRELADARQAIKGYEAMLNLSAEERKQSYETVDAFRLVQEVSRQELIDASKTIQNILSMDKELSVVTDVKPLMTKILKSAIQSLSADLGIIFLKKQGDLVPVFFENITENQITILKYIKSLVKNSLHLEGGKDKGDYVVKHDNEEKTIHYVCNSFKQDERVIGVIYLEKSANEVPFHTTDLNTLEVFSLQVSIAFQQSSSNIKIISMLREINQKNQILERAQELNVRLSQTKDAFIKNLSYELKTPLSFIHGFSELLQGTEPMNIEQIRSHVESIYLESEKLTDLLNDLLLITNLETEIKLKKENLDIKQIVDLCLSKVIEIIKRKKLEVNIAVAGEVFADRSLFTRVLMNIIKNAVFYNKRDGKLDIFSEKLKNEIRITVKDTGIGISEESQNFIFDKFYRAVNVDSYEGIGVGLFIAKKVIDLHGGSISVTSELMKGSTFQIRIPQ
ncbi:MAG TPA: HAMP domain-containing sensor histidine kinase [Leptospiraceae bacterium]|nr:HAMP domain-containing sensor histidine kinase [Leptospiraceae bacterium]HMW06259.1 HAMP domain-containing sensor histidine kinase [Leptospiraceae bacterium]HMX33180.1 HAMP domain-containing sensor histidine kinase [Leptospiraceae bacterium]HMY31721.1 HAMP domain-containing sensor histidine kinase [Leptospiraceae bacterium]HMZ64514.1 HAMP domain-containing sensor histidine kinase [Leptospiraceae bacterium]